MPTSIDSEIRKLFAAVSAAKNEEELKNPARKLHAALAKHARIGKGSVAAGDRED